MTDLCKIGEFIDVPGAPGGSRRVRIAARYNYSADPCKCPACDKLGVPWAGWFSCDSCLTVALVKTGEAFMLAPEGVR